MTAPILAQPLSVRLRERTASAHEDAEGSVFMSDLLDGSATAQAYTELSAQLYFVYVALEGAVRRHSHGYPVSAIYDPRLERVEGIARDLESLLGAEWREKFSPLPATERYVARLAEVDELQVIAHHYVRYLGDIAGGQVIARMMTRHYGIGPESLNFYDFAAIGKIKPYRDSYRASLDELSLSAEEAEAVVAEAVRAFGLNTALFADLPSRG